MSAYHPANIPTSYYTVTQAPDLSAYNDSNNYDSTQYTNVGSGTIRLPLPANHPQNHVVHQQANTPSPPPTEFPSSPSTAGRIPDPHPQYLPSTKDAAKNAKLKVHVFLDSTLYVAGGTLYGRMELNCSTGKSIRIGEIAVELTGYEELVTSTTTRSTSFLSSRVIFQTPSNKSLPPSNAVLGPQHDGFWLARKGKTTFPFVFRLPHDAPSSATWKESGCDAAVRFVVTGVIQIQTSPFTSASEDTLLRSKSASVVELFDPYNFPPASVEVIRNVRRLWMGGSGELVVEARVAGGEDGAMSVAGGTVAVAVRVQNGTKRRVQGVRAVVSQRLIYSPNEDHHRKFRQSEPDLDSEDGDLVKVTQVVAEKRFFEKDFLFDIGEERIMSLVLDVPQNIRTIRNTSLFEIECFLTIGIVTGMFSKDLSVELPLTILHPASVSNAPSVEPIANRSEGSYVDTITTVRTTISPSPPPVDIPRPSHGASGSVASYDSDEGQGFFRGHHSPAPSNVTSLLSRSASSIRSFLSTSPSPSLKDFKLDSAGGSTTYDNGGRVGRQNSSRTGITNPKAYVPAVERARYLSFGTGRAADFKEGINAMRREASGGSAFSGLSTGVPATGGGAVTLQREISAASAASARSATTATTARSATSATSVTSSTSVLNRGNNVYPFGDNDRLGAEFVRAPSLAATSLVDPHMQQERMYDFGFPAETELPPRRPDPATIDSLYHISDPILISGTSPKPLPALPLPEIINQYNSMNHHWEDVNDETKNDDDALFASLPPNVSPASSRPSSFTQLEDSNPLNDQGVIHVGAGFGGWHRGVHEEPAVQEDDEDGDDDDEPHSPHSPTGLSSLPPQRSVPPVPHFYVRRDLTPLIEESESETGSRTGTVKSSVVGTVKSFIGEDLAEEEEEWKPHDFGDVAHIYGVVELDAGEFEEKFEEVRNALPNQRPAVVEVPVETVEHQVERSDDTDIEAMEESNSGGGVVGRLWKMVGSWTADNVSGGGVSGSHTQSTELNNVTVRRELTNINGHRPTRIITDFTPPSTIKLPTLSVGVGSESALPSLQRTSSSSTSNNAARIQRKPVHDIPHSSEEGNVDTPTLRDATIAPAQAPSTIPSSQPTQAVPLTSFSSKAPVSMQTPASTHLSYAVVQANSDPGTFKQSPTKPLRIPNSTSAGTSYTTRKPVPGSEPIVATTAEPASPIKQKQNPKAKKVSPGLSEYMKKYASAVGVEEWGKRFEN